MRLFLRSVAAAGVLAVAGGFGPFTAPARAQGYGYGGYPAAGSYSGGYYASEGTVGVASGPVGYYGGYSGGGFSGGGYAGGYGGGGYYAGGGGYPGGYGGGYGGGAPYYNPNLPFTPAQQQGYREGRLFWETGIAPNHPLSPAEARGFVAGERRQANGGWRPY